MFKVKLKLGTILHSNNYGDFEIIKRYDNAHFRIKFISTGYEKDIGYSCLHRGEVRDPYYPIYYGIGCLGELSIDYHSQEVRLWNAMMARCYDVKNANYRFYGAQNITVDSRWHCCANFVKDIPLIHGYDEQLFRAHKLELDKDMQKFNKISGFQYSLKTCQFVSSKINHQEMLARRKQKTSSRYLGVTKLKDGKWQASIVIKGKNKYIGRFTTEKEAHLAYEKAKQSYELNGKV